MASSVWRAVLSISPLPERQARVVLHFVAVQDEAALASSPGPPSITGCSRRQRAADAELIEQIGDA